jgi:hypothetical protein
LVCIIQDCLQKKLGLPPHRAAKKPLMTSAMRKKRLAFARKYKNWRASVVECHVQ